MPSATSNAFSNTTFKTITFGIETQTYTYGPVSLPTGETNIFNVSNWNGKSGQVPKVCILEAIASGPSDANTRIYWTADTLQSDRAQGWLDGYPAGYRFMDCLAIAGNQLALYVNNGNSSALANFQLNYRVTVMNLSLFQRMLQGFAATSADQASLTSQQATENARAAQRAAETGKQVQAKNVQDEIDNMFAAGYRPFSMQEMMAALFDNRRVSNPPKGVPLHLVISSTATVSNGVTIPVPSGFVSVIRGVWLRSSDSPMNLMVDRDTDTAVINQLNAAAFVQADYLPLPYFLPAEDHFTAYCNGTGGTTYPVRLDIQQFRQSDLLMSHLWVPKYVTDKVQIGLQ